MKCCFPYRLGAALLAAAFAAVPAVAGAQLNGQSHAMKPMKHAASGHMSGGNVSASDRSFMMMAAEINHGEIAGGGLAQQRGTTDAVRDLGRRYVDNHSENQKKLSMLASRDGVRLPPESKVTPDDKQASMTLEKLHGRAFDMTWLSDEKKGHVSAIDEYKREVSSGSNAAVIAYAKQTLPTLDEHLDIATKDAAAMHAR